MESIVIFFFFFFFISFNQKKKNKKAFSCECPEGNTGLLCDGSSDYCSPNPCKNGGACADGINSFACDCTGTGFDGTTCQNNINNCLSNPCENGGTCIDGINCNFFSINNELFYFILII